MRRRGLSIFARISFWIAVCIPAGAMAGVGFIEFNWGGPPYDGGFLGYLVLFGGFLALGQAPFAPYILGARGLTKLSFAALWTTSGLIGWTLGQFIKVSAFPIAYSPSEPSLILWISTSSLPWILVGLFQSALIFRFCTLSPGSPTAKFLRCFIWCVACGVGGVLLETLSQVTYLEAWPMVGLSSFLRNLGVAENIADVVVYFAIFTPILYGLPTSVALTMLPKNRNSPNRDV